MRLRPSSDNEAQSFALRILPPLLSSLPLLLAAPTGVSAQFVTNATLESEYNVRGVSLDNGKPDVRLGLSYDHASGAYAGLSGIVGDTARNGVRPLGYVGYVGFARPFAPGANWDVGVAFSQVVLYLPSRRFQVPGQGGAATSTASTTSTRRYHADYTEVYGGVSVHNFSARLYLSPDYLNQGVSTAYLDLNAAFRPLNRVRLYAHAGALTPLGSGDPVDPGVDRGRFDLGAGAAFEFRHGQVQLGWTGVTPEVRYPAGYPQNRSRLVLSLAGYF